MIGSDGDVGLRERKKQRARELIAETAQRLFRERGFDAVTVDEVAREAEVSRMTVFNYFPTKEDLFYVGLELYEERLLEAIRERPEGDSILAAFVGFVTDSQGLLAGDDPEVVDRLREINRLIAESPALLAREHQIYARYTDALERLIAEETRASPDEIAPWVAANAMIGLHRALVSYVRREVLRGESDLRGLRRRLRNQARQATALLEPAVGELGVSGASITGAAGARGRRLG
jgi:AcrR family transcriptional regulator